MLFEWKTRRRLGFCFAKEVVYLFNKVLNGFELGVRAFTDEARIYFVLAMIAMGAVE